VGSQGLDLGQATDVLHVDAPTNEICVSLGGDENIHTWIFDTGPPGDDDVPYLRVRERPDSPPPPIGVAGSSFMYLGAERLGPRTSHPTAASEPDEAIVGEDGRYVAHALAINPRREVALERRHPAAGGVTTLTAQTESWLSELVGPTQLDSALVPRTGLATLHIRTPGRMGQWMLPTNTGFGVSYSLPVVVAGLLAPEGGLLVVDSPEAHLHPAAQSAIGGFLVAVAQSGVQVLLETHSDHILNGIRKAIAIKGLIRAAQVRVFFFGNNPEPARLLMNEHGRLSAWPPGFFDQFDIDLGQMARLRQK